MEMTSFNEDLMELFKREWLDPKADEQRHVMMLNALCFAAATAISTLSRGDKELADKACMVAEERIRDAVDDFMNREFPTPPKIILP